MPNWWNSKGTDFEVYAFAMHYYMPRYFIHGAFISGILRDKIMVDKLIHIPNDIKQSYPFCKQQSLTLMIQKSPQSF